MKKRFAGSAMKKQGYASQSTSWQHPNESMFD
jgi:hypothetical protein